MKNKIFRYLSILFLLGFYFTDTNAQINIGGEPISFKQALTVEIPVKKMPKLDMKAIEQQDLADDAEGMPTRFGYSHPVNYNLKNSGTWEELVDGSGRIWRLSIQCPYAKSINLIYNEFWLPPNATLYIYNKEKSDFIGGFTDKNNNSIRGESPGYATGVVPGDEIILEYFEPTNVIGLGEISISNVVHGYKSVNRIKHKLFGDSGSCQRNINCSDGNNWQNEKTSVALILVDGGTRWCTGSLLNNGYGDFKPYFLTANHCLDGWAIPTAYDAVSNPVASVWMFYWNYEATGCANPSSEPGWNSTTGAYLVANKSDSDFALLYLTEDPYRDANLILSYNGWSTNTPGAGGASIHHPSGDIKKISLFTQVPVSNAWPGCLAAESWSVVFQHPSGIFTTTEGGSSGSPLYDSNHRVVGQLWGGRDLSQTSCNDGPTCADPANDLSFYGKFSTSWDDSGGLRRRLKDWLDPTCYDNYNDLFNFSQGVEHIYANDQVNSNRSITGSNTYVSFNGGNAVHLTEGFSASGGAVFNATNIDCDNSTLKVAGELDGVSPEKAFKEEEATEEN